MAVFSVSLIDRRTGRPHRRDGAPLVVLTSDPSLAARELLSGRDAAIWEARVDALGAANRR